MYPPTFALQGDFRLDAKLAAQAEQLATQASTLDDLNGLFKGLMKTARQRLLDTVLDVHLGRKGLAAPIKGWEQALNHFAILFEGRLPLNLIK